ncbi:unnamed protein product [Didymodactylos carnosus]|uniref:Oligopeptide transporter n=1 Tax=Didymodactylos carnosus TaxID=1234261 RepID=A0A814EW25_9BILA|nr:unnamed protein product [Didymodactylos carnosus]CAF3744566.1 unnamed protein product [Didymodactylos carnosus]
MMPILTTFSWICLIQPRSILLSQLTSCHGLGLGGGCLQFDWNSITAFLGSPIVPPFWSQLNIFVGFILFAWIVVPFTYYTNLWNTKLFPIVSNNLYTINGTVYKHTFILDKQSQFNETAYELYSPVRMTVMFAFHYGIHFAILTSIIMHTILWHSQDLITQLKTSIKNSLSTKVIITTRNTVVPDYWFVILFVVTFIVTIIMCHIGQLIPVYYLFVAIIIPFLFILPAGIIVAITGQWINVNVLCDFVGGLLLHGNPIGNITFLTFAREPLLNALSLCSELKNGDYLKIPTRSLFIAHLLGMLIGGFVNYTTSSYMLNTVENICTLENPLWSCPKILTLYSTSVIWGILGPRKIFGKISPYSHLLWGFLLGLLLPILFWFIYKKIYPQRHWLKYIHVPVMLIGIGMMPTTSAGNYVTWLLIGFVCNYILHKYSLQWWKQYAYIFSIAMDSGVAVSGIFIFFIFSHQNIKFPKWWGLANDGGCPLARKTFSGK